ncbi:MAG: NAD+ synthase [Alphaproteobacteria bacterium]|nr:NAD+ synthase [Alphaproteobacteria bacterium]
MTDRLKIALAQANPIVGDIEGNLKKARDIAGQAAARGAAIVLYPELFIIGYPPEDLVLKPALQSEAMEAVRALAREFRNGPALLIGTPWAEEGRLYNAVAHCEGGEIASLRYKVDLPNYGVFDEKRVFASGPMPGPLSIRGVRIGMPICEDIWTPDVVECLSETGAEILLVPNGSPFDLYKQDNRLLHAVARVTETGLPLVYLNQVGGQDELVFDGASFVLNKGGALAVQMPSWEEAILITDWRREGDAWVCEPGPKHTAEEGEAAIYQAMMLGLRDYVEKNRFPGVVLGLSGGIDSALTAAVAVDALGADRVRALMMPSRFTSQESLDDAAGVANLLRIRLDTVPIEPAVNAFSTSLKDLFQGQQSDTTEENIQSRIRGVLLMAVSNKFGPMVLTTGNKSEMSVGYATLYGDMAGGYNVLKDLYKMQVFSISRWRNAITPKNALGPKGRVMPDRVIDKPPTAELRANQKDEDSLPPYAVLDDILACLVEGEMPVEEIARRGHDLAVIKRVENLLNIAEYKRRQAPPGVKISTRNFGRDRRYPITNRFRDA